MGNEIIVLDKIAQFSLNWDIKDDLVKIVELEKRLLSLLNSKQWMTNNELILFLNELIKAYEMLISCYYYINQISINDVMYLSNKMISCIEKRVAIKQISWLQDKVITNYLQIIEQFKKDIFTKT